MLLNLAVNARDAMTSGGTPIPVAERRYPEVIHLLLTDMGMPYMTGRQLAHVLRAERPEVRVLFVSGYAAEPSGPAPGSAEHWLAKPFAPLTLAVTVRQVLDARERPRTA